MNSKLNDRVRGCLVGGAIGDALGYAVEFNTYSQIISRYGAQGITRYSLTHDDKAEISDDTQMTLFTANGLINHRNAIDTKDEITSIRDAYIDWYMTQTKSFGTTTDDKCWLMGIEDLYSLRAPGNTCMSALHALSVGSKPYNNSKGCGGIMRVAPIAAYGALHRRDISEMTELGCEAARLTHLHPLGWLPSGLLVYVIQEILTHEGQLTTDGVKTYVEEGLMLLQQLYRAYSNDHNMLAEGTHQAMSLAQSDHADEEAIRSLGEGWTGEEAWFISIYCVLKHFDSLEQAVIAAVNHNGDSDSTGAVTGNIMGAIHGYESIPKYFISNLELHDTILKISDALYTGILSD